MNRCPVPDFLAYASVFPKGYEARGSLAGRPAMGRCRLLP